MKVTDIKIHRLKKKLTVDKAAELLDITKGSLYKIENGHALPSVYVIAKMSKVYKCSVNQIFKDLGLLE